MSPTLPVPILYLDDDPEQLKQFEARLAPYVVNPITLVSHAEDLYNCLLHVEVPAIVLVDLILPDVDGGGYEVIARLRENERLAKSRSPIIAITGSSPDELTLERASEAGADVFIHKPITLDDLVAALGRPGWFRVQFQHPPTVEDVSLARAMRHRA